ncbi:MAG: RNA polymerase-binding protein DksA [Deltaproteobacteria bacterium]|nr:RNA polymerase-binding protein DksA [Deltaproteobacteria bacterium]
MNKKDEKKFKEILQERKKEILATVEQVKEQGMGFAQDDLADEVDLASSEADQSMNLRLRDRERVLLRKIEKALTKMEAGEYGVCETCGEEIGIKRLEARPVTDLCIRCKEEQEKVERTFAE